MPSEQELTKIHEDEVRRIARARWPTAAFGGAAFEDGHERDGFFVTEDVVHLVEATVSRKKDYVQDKCTKLTRLSKKLTERYPGRAIRLWIITKDEPTADQRAVAQAHPATFICSFDQFRSSLVDARRYLDNRSRYPFGSARNPETGRPVDAGYAYVPLTIRQPTKDSSLSVRDMVKNLAERTDSYVLLGDYGAGKSMTMRQIYLQLAEKYLLSKIRVFPVLLNLRDHQGQTEPQEALERHARRIGHEQPSDLVRAWRSGFAVILLDGFDELAALGWSEQSKRLREIRYRSMELVRRFVGESPFSGGLIISGRLHYFDSQQEMMRALATDNSFKVIALEDFSEEQTKRYLESQGWADGIPAWLPSRPLLLSYLVIKGLLAEVLSLGTGLSAAAGWELLLDAICQREASIEAGIDGATVRRVIERLGTRARVKPSGMGPLSPAELIAAFTEVCGYTPDDRALVILQRLPGLGAAEGDDSSRVFVDRDLAETAKAGDVFHFLCDPFGSKTTFSDVAVTLGALGNEVVAHRASNFTEGVYLAAIESAQQHSEILQADLLRSMYCAGLALTKRPLSLEGLWIPEWTFDADSPDLSLLTIGNSIIEELQIIGGAQHPKMPRFYKCLIAKIIGPRSSSNLPDGLFSECEIPEVVASGNNTDRLMEIDIPLGARVLLTILEKIFLQPGRGRSEGALFRGLDARSQSYVDACLDLLRTHRFILLSRRGGDKVWHPIRSRTGEVKALLLNPDPKAYEVLLLAWDIAP